MPKHVPKHVPKDLMEETLDPNVDLDEWSDKLELLSRDELIKLVQKNAPEWQPTEDHTAEFIRDQLLGQAYGARNQAKDYATQHDPETRYKKQKRLLKQKGPEELQSMLADIGVIHPDGLSAKELRELALKEDLLVKWDALPEQVKLEKNRKRAVEVAAAATAAEKARRKAWEDSQDVDPDLKAQMEMKERQKKQPWEIDWDQSDEDEAIERLSRLEMFKHMDPTMLEGMMQAIRKDKTMLDALEGEEKMKKVMADATADGSTLTLGDMKRIGASVTSFDKSKGLDDIKMDAQGAFA